MYLLAIIVLQLRAVTKYVASEASRQISKKKTHLRVNDQFVERFFTDSPDLMACSRFELTCASRWRIMLIWRKIICKVYGRGWAVSVLGLFFIYIRDNYVGRRRQKIGR